MKIKQYEIVNDKEFKPELLVVREYSLSKKYTEDYLRTDKGKLEFLKQYFHMTEYSFEHVVAIACNPQHDFLGFYCFSMGDSTSTQVIKKNLFTFLLLIGATDFYLFHNHPNNIAYWSDGDIAVNSGINMTSRMFEMNYVANYILTRDGVADIKDEAVYTWDNIKI